MKHLGNLKTEYVDQYDKSLLERIERAPRREGYIQMYGYDVWTAFEFSFLLSSGLPVTKVIRIFTNAESPYIFESKSLKLYLNSFNNTKFKIEQEALHQVQTDLSEVAGGRVRVVEVQEFPEPKLYSKSLTLRGNDDGGEYSYDYNNLLLKTVEHRYQSSQTFHTDLLRSNCEITNQPDFGRCFVSIITKDRLIDPQSLLRYIVSYRNHQEFHEPTCERIFQDLYNVLEPIQLMVICQYTRRGGIDINPIRSLKPIGEEICFDLPRLIQQ